MAAKTRTRKASAQTIANWRAAVQEDPQGEYAVYAREQLEKAGCDISDLPAYDPSKPIVSYGPGEDGKRPVVATYAPGTKVPEAVTAADVARTGNGGGDTRTARPEPKPTEGELRFIERLLAERDLITVIGGVNLNEVLIAKYHDGTITKRQARELGNWLKQCPYKGQAPTAAAPVRPATPRQLESVIREGARREVVGSGAAPVAEIVRKAVANEAVSFKEASFALDVLLASKFAPRDARPAQSARKGEVTEDGMYARTENGERVFYKVQIAKQGSGNLYAKRLERDASRASGWRFVYAPGAIRSLTPADKLSLEEAQQFGQLYGVCCVCAAELTDEDSIAKGIGPICEGRV